MDTTIQQEGSINRLRYGRKHPIKRVMEWPIIIHKNPHLGVYQTKPRVLHSISTRTGTISSMRIYELKSNMQENHLITSQWWKLLTYGRETTNDDDGRQGTKGTINKMWKMIWHGTSAESLDRRPMMWNLHRMRKTCHWGMQAPRYQKGVFRSNSWIMSWSRQEVTWSKEGHNVFPHHRHETEENDESGSGPTGDQRKVEKCRGKLLLNISIARHWIWQYLTSKDLRSWWRGKE